MVDPICAKSNTETAEHSREKLRIDKDDPSCPASNKETEEPRWPNPKIDIVLENLAKLRKDKLDPMCFTSSTESDDPRRTKLRIETEEPS